MYLQKDYTPYTYLVGWSSLDKWYYGVRWAMKDKCLYETGCHPDDFWKTYFTSSSTVTEMIEQYGEPDITQVRKTFSTANEAREWEEKVLTKMNVLHNDRWLNKHISGKFYNEGHSDVTRKKISDGLMGHPPTFSGKHTEETLAKMSEIKQGSKNPFFGKKHSKASKRKKSKAYIFISPDGTKYDVLGLNAFCQEHNIDPSAMSKVAKGVHKQHKGWTVRL